MKTHEVTFSDKWARRYISAQTERNLQGSDFSQYVLESNFKNSEIVRTLKSEGLTKLRGFLSESKIAQIRSKLLEMLQQPEYLGRVRHHRMEHEQGLKFGDFRYLDLKDKMPDDLRDQTNILAIKEPLLNLPEILPIILDERLLSYSTAYHGAVPKLTYVKVFRSHANDLPNWDTNLFHADTGSYWILKAIIYLDEVNEGDGPFTYAKGSHHHRFLPGFNNDEFKLKYQDEEIVELCSEENIVNCVGSPGDVFLADTTGFHRASKPKNKDRIAIIANYCIHDEEGFEYKQPNLDESVLATLSPVQLFAIRHMLK